MNADSKRQRQLKEWASSSSAAAAADAHHFRLCDAPKVVVAVVASLAWMVASSGLILLNQHLLSHGFHYPMALSGLGMAFSGVASHLCCQVFNIVEAKKAVSPQFYVSKILPVGLSMALALHFGNAVYLYLTVAFIQILKAFTPIVTMASLFVARLETPTRPLVLSVSLIALGTMLSSAGEVNVNMLGLLFMFLSTLFESVRLVMTQLLLTGLKFHPIEGLMYLAPACTFWLFLGSLLLEFRTMVAEGAFALMAQQPLRFVLAAAMGFMVNALAYIVIQSASSLTLKVLGTVKNAVVVCLGIGLLGEHVTLLQGVGYGVSIAAFAVYQRTKMRQLAEDDAGKNSLMVPIIANSNSQPGPIGELLRYKAMPNTELLALPPSNNSIKAFDPLTNSR